jgi:hypothetical protein
VIRSRAYELSILILLNDKIIMFVFTAWLKFFLPSPFGCTQAEMPRRHRKHAVALNRKSEAPAASQRHARETEDAEPCHPSNNKDTQPCDPSSTKDAQIRDPFNPHGSSSVQKMTIWSSGLFTIMTSPVRPISPELYYCRHNGE